MAQEDINSSGSKALSGLKSFVNSRLGTLLIGSAIGILGLFTWQRQDWLYKEQYHRDQIILDRQIELVERIHTEIGSYLARADTAIATYEKGAPARQREEWIVNYNNQQAQWFGSNSAFASLLGIYFPSNVADKFGQIVESTNQLDNRMSELTEAAGGDFSQESSAARQASQEVRDILGEWNDLVSQYVEGDQGTIARFKRLLTKAGQAAANAFRDVLVDVVSETVRKALWP